MLAIHKLILFCFLFFLSIVILNIIYAFDFEYTNNEDTRGVSVYFMHKLSKAALEDNIIKYKIADTKALTETEDNDIKMNYTKSIHDAIDNWQKETELGEYIQFEQIPLDSSEAEDITFMVMKRFPAGSGDTIGNAQTSYRSGSNNIEVPEMYDCFIRLSATYSNEQIISERIMTKVATHELGRCLGLQHTEPEGKKLIMNSVVIDEVESISKCEADAVISNNFKPYDKFLIQYVC